MIYYILGIYDMFIVLQILHFIGVDISVFGRVLWIQRCGWMVLGCMDVQVCGPMLHAYMRLQIYMFV